jgi:hypothetical protein
MFSSTCFPTKLSSACCISPTRATCITFTYLIWPHIYLCESRDSSVGIALGYGLENRGSRVRFSAMAGNFSLHHRIQNGSGDHTASYPMGTRGLFPWR